MPDFAARMAETSRNYPFERDVEQAITALKKGAHLLKYGRRGKPKFCPFRLSVDESALIWYSGKVGRQLILNHVSKIIPGQRTAIFQRYPQPDKEYQSFSLIYNDRSLDLICKDKDEAEVWFVGLKALISHGNYLKKLESKRERTSETNGPNSQTFVSSDIFRKDSGNTYHNHIPYDNPPHNVFGKVFSDVILYTAPKLSSAHSDSVSNSPTAYSSGGAGNSIERISGSEDVRASLSSAVSSSSHGSCRDDFDGLGDIFVWGEGISDGVLGGGLRKSSNPLPTMIDAALPKALEAAVLLDVQNVACGSRHAALVTNQGEVYSWGEESGGRLGHGVDADISHPKVIDALSGINIEFVACGEYHTCALSLSGELYTWGDGTHNSGLLGHGSEVSHWIPKLVRGQLEGLHVSFVSCGPSHTALVTSTGQLFTFGDGTFGALGHGDDICLNAPREVESLRGMHTIKAACGVWHTAAIVQIVVESTDSDSSPSGKLFTWGDGDKGRLGHGDQKSRLLPACVVALAEPSFCQVACGKDITIALTTSGRVYTMGSSAYGQLGNCEMDGKLPTCLEGKLCDSFVEEISCGSCHAAILTSTSEVYTWGKGANGQLGHGDFDDRITPTLVEALKGKQVKNIVCGSNFTAAICLHKWVSSADLSICSGCRLPFGFRRKSHNCYNCGLVFCSSCSSRKSEKAALAPNINKPYRVCDECYNKIKKTIGSGMRSQIPKHPNGSPIQASNELVEKETLPSRLCSADSSVHDGRSKQNLKSEGKRRSSLWGNSYFSKPASSLYKSSNKIFSASNPSSRISSRSTSPVSSMPSPSFSTATFTSPGSPDLVVDYSRRAIDSLSNEVARLNLQVKNLTQKSQLLEAEMEKSSRQLREATAVAGEETTKCKAAKEVIKSLTAQLKDMAQKVPEGYVIDVNGTLTEEWVEQDEPGVYVSVSSNPGGEIYLKRVRFSRKQFTEAQAEKWWAENKPRVQKKYSFFATKGTTNNFSSLSDRNDNMID